MLTQVLGDRYSVQQQLASKAGRRTLLARDLQTQELVIVKLMTFSSDFEWNELKLFEREAETLKALFHPSIPSYLDFIELDKDNLKGFALIQTYIPAKSLEEHLKAGRTFSEAEVKQLAKTLLSILVYLHGRQPPVIHRDIKPSNILLTNRSGNSVGQVYLVDFGSVQTLAAKEGGTITIVGTYGYMPPEQFGARTVPASDLYSLGATLITLATGTHPADLPQTDLLIEFEQAANLSPAFADWLKWMTEPSLNKRLNSAQEALKALENEQQRFRATVSVKKPSGSKVTLTKNADSLEILTRSIRFGICPLVSRTEYVFMQVFYALLLAMVIGILSRLSNNLDLFLLILVVGIWVLIIFFYQFKRTRLHIDRQQISLNSEFFGFKWKLLRLAQRQDILSLNRTSEVGEILPGVILWVGAKKIEIGGDGRLFELEIDWLAQELSDYLGMPITKSVD